MNLYYMFKYLNALNHNPVHIQYMFVFLHIVRLDVMRRISFKHLSPMVFHEHIMFKSSEVQMVTPELGSVKTVTFFCFHYHYPIGSIYGIFTYVCLIFTVFGEGFLRVAKFLSPFRIATLVLVKWCFCQTIFLHTKKITQQSNKHKLHCVCVVSFCLSQPKNTPLLPSSQPQTQKKQTEFGTKDRRMFPKIVVPPNHPI